MMGSRRGADELGGALPEEIDRARHSIPFMSQVRLDFLDPTFVFFVRCVKRRKVICVTLQTFGPGSHHFP